MKIISKLVAAVAIYASITTAASAAPSFKLAITGPFSGGSAPMGVSMRNGAELAIQQINAGGGIDVGGKKLKIDVIERDDEAKNARGVLIAQELASMKGLSAVIGTVNTGVAVAGDRFLQQAKVVKIITPAAGSATMMQWTKSPAPKSLYMFRFSANDGIQAQMVVEQAIRMGFKKVAIFHDTTNYGVSGRDDLLRQIKAQGNKLQVVAKEQFNIGERDMTAQLLQARFSGAQAILIWGIGPELAAVANDMTKIGYKVPMIGGWTLSMSSYIDNAGKNANGTLMPQTFIEAPINARAKAFITAYHQAYHVKRIPSPMSAAQGYDAVYLLAAAVKQAASTDPTKIKDALENLQHPVHGVIATWKKPFAKWNPADVNTHEAFRRDQVVMGEVKDGRVVFANTEDRQRLASE